MARMLRRTALPVLLATATALAGCATVKPPEISYDSSVPPLPAPPAPIVEARPQPLHTPPACTPSRGATAPRQPTARGQNARKSVGWGKSVVIRGDLGGRRNMYKKQSP